MRLPDVDDDDAVGAAIVVVASPHHRSRFRRCPPKIWLPDSMFEAVVEKRRVGSISTLAMPEGAVWAGIIVLVAIVVGPKVFEERGGRHYGRLQDGQLEVVQKGKIRT